jgi:hypothetical protein
MKKSIGAFILTLVLFSSLVGCSKDEVKEVKPEMNDITMKDKDGLILFSLSLNNALAQIARKEKSAEIEITEDTQKTSYHFKGHVLSCGTHMLGNVIEEKIGDQTSFKGSFKVSTNPYDIKTLEIDALQDVGGLYSGTLIVDGKKLDIALL